MKITPTVGRVVLFRPFDQDYDHDKRHAATIAQVNVDGTLNLGVLNDYGVSQAEQNITLVQGDDKPGYGQAEWMPYQKGQAAKTESVLAVDPFSDEALELALERVLESRADRQHATNDDGSDNEKENTGSDLIVNLCADAAFLAHQHYKSENGQPTAVEWTDEQKERYIAAAAEILETPNMTAEERHDDWMDDKLCKGWIYGEVLDIEAKQHPNIASYEDLSDIEQHKATLIIDTVLQTAEIKVPEQDLTEDDLSPLSGGETENGTIEE